MWLRAHLAAILLAVVAAAGPALAQQGIPPIVLPANPQPPLPGQHLQVPLAPPTLIPTIPPPTPVPQVNEEPKAVQPQNVPPPVTPER